jgi:hypothetical protein
MRHWTGLLATLLVRFGGISASLQKWALQQQDGLPFAKGTKKRLYHWPVFFTCSTPFTARLRHSAPEQPISSGAECSVKKH